MKISAYILANRAQEVPVPIPGEEVQATIATTNNVRHDTYMFKYENEDGGIVYPAGGADIAESRSWGVENTQSSGEYYASQGEDCVPCNIGGGTNATAVVTVKPEHGGRALWNGRHYIYDYMNYLTPNGTITVSGLQPGKYVFELLHWVGYDDKTSETSIVRVDGYHGRVVKSGAHGVIEGEVFPTPTRYAGRSTGSGTVFRGYVVKARLRYAFTVEEGDTSKAFEFGSGKDISFTDLWDCVFMQELSGGQPTHSVWANCHISFNAKVYTAR